MGENLSQTAELERKCEGVWYSETAPAELLQEGVLLSLDDFRLACEVTRQQTGQGLSVFRALADFLARRESDEALFDLHTCINQYRKHLDRTRYLYIETQSVYDLIVLVENDNHIPGIGEKGLQLMRAVVYDEGPGD